MIAKLRDAKEQLSDLVKRASAGEEFIITVRGKPMARLSQVQGSEVEQTDRVSFAEELARLAEAVRTDATATNTQEVWNELREDRF